MHPDLQDIDPSLVEAVLVNADAFIKADVRVDEIVVWGETQIDALYKKTVESNGTLEEYKSAVEKVREEVADKLGALKSEVSRE